jgi:hypothetical protein
MRPRPALVNGAARSRTSRRANPGADSNRSPCTRGQPLRPHTRGLRNKERFGHTDWLQPYDLGGSRQATGEQRHLYGLLPPLTQFACFTSAVF